MESNQIKTFVIYIYTIFTGSFAFRSTISQTYTVISIRHPYVHSSRLHVSACTDPLTLPFMQMRMEYLHWYALLHKFQYWQHYVPRENMSLNFLEITLNQIRFKKRIGIYIQSIFFSFKKSLFYQKLNLTFVN